MTTEENVRGGEVLLKLVPDMDTMTSDRTLAMGLENAQRNNDLITAGKSIRDLRTLPMSSDDRALVLAAGRPDGHHCGEQIRGDTRCRR